MMKPKYLNWDDQIDKIAAAPWLLAGCEEALEVLQELAAFQDIGERGRETIEKLKKAIAQTRVKE